MSKEREQKYQKLIEGYKKISGKLQVPANVKLLCEQISKDTDSEHEWQKINSVDFPYKLSEIDPFALPVFNDINIGLSAEVNQEVYHHDAFDLPGSPAGEPKKSGTKALSTSVLRDILSAEDRDKLLINHNKNSSKTAKQVLDGFSVERLIECYAEGISDDAICKYLHIRPGQLKSWIAMSQQRINIVTRMQDILRSQNIEKTIGEAFDYQIGEIFDKADASYESLRLEAMKMRTRLASDLDNRRRTKDVSDGGSLPVVNLGLQVNVNEGNKNSLGEVRAVIPGILREKNDS